MDGDSVEYVNDPIAKLTTIKPANTLERFIDLNPPFSADFESESISQITFQNPASV